MVSQASFDKRCMRRVLSEARRGHPSPNPHVGAMVVREGVVLSLGHHERAGEAHAEVVALRGAGEAARGATLYVSFEPCNHYGRTPPCTEAILKAGIARVVIGCRDPAPHVPGAMERLRDAGLEVVVGVLQEEAEALIAGFYKHHTRGLPQVTLKAAATLDGSLALRSGHSKWITGEAARKYAHQMRARSDALLVGIGTVLADDPQLTVRALRGRNPLRVVLDSALRLPLDAALVQSAAEVPTLVFHAVDADPEKITALKARGLQCQGVSEAPGEGLLLSEVLKELGRRNVVELLVEGGAKVHGAFLRQRLADRLALFLAPTIFGDAVAPRWAEVGECLEMSRAFRVSQTRWRRLGPDLLLEGGLQDETAGASVGACSPESSKTSEAYATSSPAKAG